MINVFDFFRKKEKEKLDCLGYFEVKPYHYFESNMVYAKDIQLKKDSYTAVYVRYYRGTVFVLTFVENETNFDKSLWNYQNLKEEINKVILEPITSAINLIIFKNKNEQTISIAKEKTTNTKTEFNQILIYDSDRVRLCYYRPVPDFYKLYENYAEAIYFDLAAIDATR